MRTSRTTLALSASFLLVAADFAAAQIAPHLVGVTRTTPIVDARDHFACTPLPFCAPAGLPPAAPLPYPGGTAWDPTRNGIFVSTGQLIAEVDENTCNYICPPVVAPTSSPNALVTGLEYCESLNQIWILDSFGVLTQCAIGCPPVPVASCNTGLPLLANASTGGLAVDEKNGFVFYGYSDWSTLTCTVHIARVGLPCQITQVVTPLTCATTFPLRGITGLAVDACRQTLFMTDGFQTVGWDYTVVGPNLAFGATSCCMLPPSLPGDQWIGLALRTGKELSVGTTCSVGTCAPCAMQHVMRNSPNLGNGFFRLGIDNAPLGSLAMCGLGVGPCNPVGPTIAPFCGPILISLPTIATLGPVLTAPGVGCGGTATFPLPLPNNPLLCGLVLSSQALVFCPGGGNSVSNCISFMLQSN